MRKAKILFVIGTLDIGGAETQLVELASRLDRERFEAIVCCIAPAGPLASTLHARGITVHALGFRRLFPGTLGLLASLPRMAGMFWRLWRLVRRERPEVVHAVLLAAYVLATFTARLARVPVVVAGRRSLGLFKERKRVYRLLENVADRMTDLFIANSEAVRVDTLEREPIRPSDIVVIYNGLDLSRFDAPVDPALPESLHLGTGPRVIVVSNLIAYKGHEYFLRAWALVLKSFPTASAILVGEGPLRGRLETVADGLGIRGSVHFLGTRRDVPSLLAISDVYVHPSLEEGYSNSLLEAMAAARPVVATAVGGNVEAVTDGVTGVLVPARDEKALAHAMSRFLSDPQAARSMGERASVSARARHGVDAMVHAYENVYDELLKFKTNPGRTTMVRTS